MKEEQRTSDQKITTKRGRKAEWTWKARIATESGTEAEKTRRKTDNTRTNTENNKHGRLYLAAGMVDGQAASGGW